MGKTKIKTVEETTEVKPEKVQAAQHVAKEASATGKKNAAKEDTVKAKKVRSRKYQAAREKVERNKHYPLTEAVKTAQQASYTKFPATMEVHINTTTKGLRGLVTLPYTAGKKLTILAFGSGAKEASADIVGTEETIGEIEKGKINFDVVVTTPQWMPKLARAAKTLGPRGLMPNPKSGTITDNLTKTVAELQQGKTEYKTEANGQIIHLAVGKVNQSAEEISANIKALYNTIGRSRIKSIFIAPTMGPSVKVEVSSLS